MPRRPASVIPALTKATTGRRLPSGPVPATQPGCKGRTRRRVEIPTMNKGRGDVSAGPMLYRRVVALLVVVEVGVIGVHLHYVTGRLHSATEFDSWAWSVWRNILVGVELWLLASAAWFYVRRRGVSLIIIQVLLALAWLDMSVPGGTIRLWGP